MSNNTQDTMTPRQIVKILDKHIIGQKDAKKNIAIALRNRWRRQQVEPNMRKEIKPANILMIGDTGTGKTELARRLARIDNRPFFKAIATKYTEQGYVGGDTEGMIRGLAEESYKLEKQSMFAHVKEKAIKNVENIILDILIPPLNHKKSSEHETKDIKQEDNLNAQTRLRFREKIQKGMLDHREVEIEIEQEASTGIGFMGHGMMDESAMMNIQNMMKKILPKNIKRRKVTIAEARELLFEQEVNKLIDPEKLKKKAVKSAETGIVFIDEIDKICSTSRKSNGPDVSREGVQRDLLGIVEGCKVNTKYGVVDTDYVLFISAGAFHQSKPSDLIPELQGRLPIRVQLDKLSKQDFCDILEKPENSLIKQNQAICLTEKVELVFQKDAIKIIADYAFYINQNIENIGARRLVTVMNHLLKNLFFDMPDKIKPGETIVITKEFVIKSLAKLAQEKDISRYIL